MTLPAFLTARLAGVAFGGVALLLAITLAWVTIDKNGTIRTLHDEIHNPTTGYAARLQRTERSLTTCQANTMTLDAALRRQNAAVAVARREGERRVAELDRVAVQARQQRAAADARARAILGRAGSGDHCADAEALIRESIG